MAWWKYKNLKVINSTLKAEFPSIYVDGLSGSNYTAEGLDIYGVVDALKVLKGTLDGLPEGDLARTAVHLAAARVQLGLGNASAARGQLEAALRVAPGHEAAVALLATLPR